LEFLKWLVGPSGFMPHGYCYRWVSGLLWLHGISDTLIFLAYMSIPVTLMSIVRRRKDLPFNWILVCFGVFIVACGLTHAMEVWNLWHAMYWLAGLIKAVTAAASVATAVLLVRLVPQAVEIPSADDLFGANARLIGQAAALSASEEKFRGLLEAAPDAMVIVDPGGIIELANAQAEKLFGYTKQELLGQSVDMLVPKTFREGHGAHRQGFFAAPKVREMGKGGDLYGLRKDGTEFPVEISLSPLETDTGTLALAAIRDGTQRRKAETRYRALLEAAPDAMVIVGLDGIIELVNAQTERLFGYTEQELLGQSVDILMPKKFREGHGVHRQGFFAAPRVREMGKGLALYGLRKDGIEFPVEISLSPLETDTGTLALAAIRDITVRKQAEETLRLSEESSRLLVSNVKDYAILMLDRQGNVASWNEGAERMKGYRAEEIIGQHFSRFYPIEDIRLGKPAFELEEVARVGRFEDEAWRVRKDGSRFFASVVTTALHDKTGLLRGFGKITRDITERRRSEEHLAKTAEDLKRSNDQLEQFAYVASHDLQEPLRMVASYTQLLAKRYQGRLDSDADEFIAYAVDGCNRMQGLIRDLLTYSRSGTESKLLNEISSEIALKEALTNLRVSIEESGAIVTHDLLPAITTDDTQLMQVLQNLIGNAIKYRGAAVPLVHVSATKNGGKEWIFSVRDNGLGIAPQYFERIFIIFQRLHGRQEFNGTGIGLAICKKIVERLGGRIWVESQLEKGSTFYFSLPESNGK
jgi:PAS domain S-box-containing protein